MKTIRLLPLIVLLFGCTQNESLKINPDKVDAEIKTTVVNENFGGVGFDVFDHMHKASRWNYEQVFAKRWRELNPSFARVPDHCKWDFKQIDEVSWFLDVLKETNTEIYVTTFSNNCLIKGKNEIEYVKHEVDNLEYLKKVKGFDRITYYCMANELSLGQWASMVKDLDFFKMVHGLFYNELKSRGLDIELLASDASPFEYWHTIEWAANNMDSITGIYGGHHYINNYDIFDNTFYKYFYDKLKWGADLSKSKNKRFIMGEFGAKQNSNIIDSVMHDANMYNHVPLEKYMGIQVSEAILAIINSGVYACGYWTFSDFPFPTTSHRTNKWGLYHWEIDNYTTKPSYYCLGLLTKFFRGPSEAYEVVSSDSLLRFTALKNKENGSISVAVINRNNLPTKVSINMGALTGDKSFRKYLYDPENVPFNYFGDLQGPSGKISLRNNKLNDVIPAQSLVVYTTCYDEDPPSNVKGLQVENKKDEGRDRAFLTWEANSEKDFCYYRIYRSEKPDVEISGRKQIASTISNSFKDISVHNMPQYYYKVVAVDQSGNAGR
ncbi:MAG: hypothetical protein A2X04_05935 [Bacteroidetes bacterium GWF2_41_9]|nr:MAG: hypothetical protein A2X03_09825 [Bacteroidetes bacterium GWA2_40_15]OFY59952.1 MAG: hypothetical protein A2X04_05935 [Bacteroidetes bacterium GWF2_41_9]